MSHGAHTDTSPAGNGYAQLAPSSCSAKRALELCEFWTTRDIEQYHDAPFRKNLEHRLACIREGMTDPIFQSPGCQRNAALPVADSRKRVRGGVTAGETAVSPNNALAKPHEKLPQA